MKLPILNELPTSRELIDVFGGYNHNLRIGEGEFYDMKNLTSSNYPVLSTRPQRGVYASVNTDDYPDSNVIKISNPSGLLAKDALCYADGTNIVINGYTIDMGLSTQENMCPKTLVSMGAYIIIMPDKKYINTTDFDDNGKIEHIFKNYKKSSNPTSNFGSFCLCSADGLTTYERTPQYASAPTNPTDGQMYIDTSETPHRLRKYSEVNAEWITITSTYVRVYFSYIWTKNFNVGDGITISGITTEGLTEFNTTTVIKAIPDASSIVIPGIVDGIISTYDEVIVTRVMPEMDFVIESGNRLWGCRYGLDINGNFVNEIYASKLGDFKNWNVFDSISTDSYVATVGTDGQFTGAITHLGYPIFFKDNHMHKVYGNYPANFQVQTTSCRGVQKGCHKSLAIVNEALYYKSRSAICMYDGSLPVEISSALGDESYSNAVAGALRNKYYISMKDSNGEYHLFVFDTKRGAWHKEDNTQAVEFCTCQGELYYIEGERAYVTVLPPSGQSYLHEYTIAEHIKTINTIPDKSFPFETAIDWMAESGIIGINLPDKKYISRLDVRMILTVGTRTHFYVEYDSCGTWEYLFTMAGTRLQSFVVPIRPRRCDHMRIRIAGDGDAKLYSICKTIEQGSDL